MRWCVASTQREGPPAAESPNTPRGGSRGGRPARLRGPSGRVSNRPLQNLFGPPQMNGGVMSGEKTMTSKHKRTRRLSLETFKATPALFVKDQVRAITGCPGAPTELIRGGVERQSEEATMHVVIGPVLARAGGYAFDSWTPEDGLSCGYIYRRVEDAHYARSVEIRSRKKQCTCQTIACSTVGEFCKSIHTVLL